MTTDQSAMDRAKGTASTATDEGKHVGGVAKDEVRNVASTAAEQARAVTSETVDQLREQLVEQTSGQRDRLVSTLQSFGDDLERMAGQAGDGGMAADLARQAASRARALREHVDGREPGQLLDDVRDFARRRPGTFLLGALVAGVAAGRLLRGTADGAAAAELATPEHTIGRPGTGDADDPLSAPPTVSSGSAPMPPPPTGPALTPDTHGHTTIQTP
jgi:hypothetical protein